MSRWQQAFWVLLRCGLWEREADDLTPFPLNADEWTRVYNEALRQTVQGLIYRGFQHLPEALFPPEETTAKLLMASMQAEASYRQALETTVSVSKAFNTEGHDHYLLKGIASAMLYEHPELRVQGDVDFYVPSPPVKKKQTDAEGSLCYECNGMMVELHRHLIDICHPMKRKAIRKTVDMPPQEITLQNGYTLKTPQPLATLVMMNAHLLKQRIESGFQIVRITDLNSRTVNLCHYHHRPRHEKGSDQSRHQGLRIGTLPRTPVRPSNMSRFASSRSRGCSEGP